MKRFKVLSAAFAGIFVYVLLSILAGRDGIFAARQLEEQKRILGARTEKIQKINDSLNLEKTALEKDYDVIEGLARKLGFVSADEKLVKINGLYFSGNTVYDSGTPLRAEKVEFVPEWLTKSLGAFVFLFVYLYLTVKELKRLSFGKRKKTFTEGVPVYDLPQV